MNTLAIDYGTKKIGLAYSVNGIISSLPMAKNDHHLFQTIINLIDELKIDQVYVGISSGYLAKISNDFVKTLQPMIKLNIETVDESFSTIEATSIQKHNKSRQSIDSTSAAVILSRVINL
jgi:putative transcription antitermination factor YqgF